MPYLSFNEINTPLKLLGIRFFKCMDNNGLYIKVWKNRRKKIK